MFILLHSKRPQNWDGKAMNAKCDIADALNGRCIIQ